MRGGSLFGESRSLGKPEKAIENRRNASQENCSNEVKTQGSASTEPVVFCCGKTAAAALCRVAAVFCCGRLCVDSPSALIAWTVTARKPTEYCFIDAVWESGGNPEQPSIAVS